MNPKRWARKVRRRKPGIYLARTEQHRRPGRYENGYVGRSVNVHIRTDQHLGRLGYSATIGRSMVLRSASSGQPLVVMAGGKPWADLAPRWFYLRLSWWLGWTWILAPLEAFAIVLLAPRYNDRLNRWNPRRVPIWQQHAQRRQRDAGTVGMRVRRAGVRWAYTAARVAGLALIFTGLTGWYLTGH